MTGTQSKISIIENDWKERIGMAFATAAAVALTTGVIAAFIYFVIGLASIISIRQLSAAPIGVEASVSAPTSAPLQKTISTIAQYQARFGTPRFSADGKCTRTNRRRATLSGNSDRLRIQQ